MFTKISKIYKITNIQYPQWPLIILYAYRSSLDAAEKPFNIQHFQKQKYAICGETQHNGIKENSKICEETYAKKTYKPKFTCKTKFLQKFQIWKKKAVYLVQTCTTIKLALKVAQVIFLFF